MSVESVSPEWPIFELGNEHLPITLQKIGDMDVDIKASHLIRGAYRYFQSVDKEIVKNKDKNYLGKARGYSQNIRSFMNNSYPLANLQKDAPILTTTTGFYNQVYGNQLFSQINNEQNAWGLLRKLPWDKSGWRVITAAGATSDGGQSESGAVPSTIKPTIAQVSTKPKVIATGFNVTALQQGLSLGEDDSITNTIEAMRKYAAIEHGKLINRMLLKNVTTLASTNMESIDRVVSSNSEVTNCGDVDANDSDIYSLDRDSGATWADAYVNHNSNTDRDFSLSLLDSLETNTRPYLETGDRNAQIFLTGHDTYQEIKQHHHDKLRFASLPQGTFMPSVNGVSAIQPGVDGGFQVSLYNGIPIFVSDDVVQDTLSRVYLLNLNYMFAKVLMPTMYFQTGLLTNGDPFGIDFLGDEGLFVTMAELVATKFRVHAKLRDLQ